MIRRMTIPLLSLCWLALGSICATAAPLPVTIDFTSSLLETNLQQTVTFTASLVNTSSAPVFLNSDALNIATPLVANDASFFLNFPAEIAPNATIPAAPVFTVTVPAGAALTLYPGTFTILGGSSLNSADIVGTANFAVAVVVPEPGTWSLLPIGICWLMVVRLRRKRRSAARV